MALISIKRNVDLQPGLNAPAVFNCSQGDKGTTMMLGLMNGGNDYTVPSGITITIRGSRSNGAVFTPTSATFSGSTVSFTLTEEMTDTAGPTLCEAVLEQGNNVLGTANFIINVEGSPMGADVPPVFTDAAWAWMLGKLTTETVPALGDDVISSIQGKVDKNQGSTNAKKFLRVNTSGNVSLASTDKTLLIADQIADAKETGDQIRALDAEIDGVTSTLGGSISTLNGITTDLQSSKLNKNQGASNAGKVLMVNNDGTVSPEDVDLSGKANESTIAPEFDSSASYTAGQYVYKNGVLYRFTANHTGAWTGSDAVEVTVEGEIKRIGSGSGLTESIKTALLACFEKVAWIDEDGQDYYDALYNALYAPIPATGIALSSNSLSFATIGVSQTLTATLTPSDSTSTIVWSSSDTSVATVTQGGVVTSVAVGSATITATAGNASATCSILVSQATLSSISAVYTQSGTVYDTYSLDSLKSDLVVTATWSDSSTSIIASTDYTLTGTLTVGTSTVTVSYGGKTDTFTVTVSSSNNYIAVGNPVIVDGILSPTEGNFIKTPDVFSPGNNPWKIITKYKFSAVPGASKFQDVMGSVDSSNTSVRGVLMECAGNANASGASMQTFISSNTSSWDIVGNLTLYKQGLDTNWLWYEVSFDGTETYAIRWSTDGENWTTSGTHYTKTSSLKIVGGYAIGFGIKRDTTLNGEIDLNECRIYINNQLWWQPIAS